jgi:hypothetical protein
MATTKQVQKQLEKKGWKFTFYMSGNGVKAVKGARSLTGTSLTNLFKKIRGY